MGSMDSKNSSFEGLPSKILCANVLRTLRSHWSYTHFSFTVAITRHACHLIPAVSIKNSTRAWPTCTYNERREQANLVLFMYCFLCS